MISTKKTAFTLALTLLSCQFLPALAKQEDEYKAGVALYTSKDYAKAADKFWNSITQGNNDAIAYLYMAHSYAGAQNIYESLSAYHSVVDLYKGTPEATLAAACIKRMDPQNVWRRGQPLPASLAPAKPAVVTASKSSPNIITTAAPGSASGGMLARLTVLAPSQTGHDAVSASTIKTVKAAVQLLPANFAKMLVEGGANIIIAPNSSDKWPESINQVKSGETTYAQEVGHCYGRDMYIYERPIVEKGVFKLGEARKSDEIRWVTVNQLFHALDNCGQYTKDPNMVIAYNQDLEIISDEKKGSLGDYLAEGSGIGETFAEIGVALLGVQGQNTNEVANSFIRTKAYMRKKLRI